MAQKIIGVTGAIGTGKTAAARMLKSFGGKSVLVLDADKIARKFLKKGSESSRAVAQFFPEAMGKKGDIDPKKLANVVFENKGKLSMLNSLVHPFVIRAIRQRLDKFSEHVIVLDVPLLVEADMLDIVDFLVIVDADKKAVVKRSKFSRKDIERRSAHQLPFEEKKNIAQKKLGNGKVFVINNSYSRQKTREQISAVWKAIEKLK